MRKFKYWLCNKFLPAYCKEELQDEVKRLLSANAAQKQEIAQLNAYINGIESAMRIRSKITINNGVRE
ncbi:hypothetical protein DSECCO2_442180 [anaerobic digester metagenome]